MLGLSFSPLMLRSRNDPPDHLLGGALPGSRDVHVQSSGAN